MNINSLILSLLVFNSKNQFFYINIFKKYYKNHIYIYLYQNIKKILFFLKNTFQFNLISLIEITGVDLLLLKNYNLFFNINFFNKLIIYNLIDYKSSVRYIFNLFVNNNIKIFSLDKLFLNSNWMERELIEFFGLNILNKIDTRNLLLDYNLLINPLLKIFPCEGYQEIYFNFNTYNLDYINSEFIEL